MKRFSVFYLTLILISLSSCKTLERSQQQESVAGESSEQRRGAWTSNNRNARASFYYMISEDKLLHGKVLEALDYLTTAYELNPNPFLASKLLDIEIMRGAGKRALLSAKRYSLMYPKSGRVTGQYGAILFQSGQFDRAEQQLEKALSLGFEKDFLFLRLLQIATSKQKKKSILRICKKWVKAIPNSALGHFELAKAYLNSKKNKSAMRHASIAVQLQPDQPEFLLLSALTKEMNGKSKEAVMDYEKLYRINSGSQRLLVHMAKLYKRIGEPEDALELIDEVLKKAKRSNAANILAQKGIILWDMGRHQEAAEIFIDLAQQNPGSKRYQYLSGLALEKEKRYKEANQIYLQLEESPKFFRTARIRRAVIASRLGKLSEAVSMIQYLQKKDSTPDPELSIFIANFYGEAAKPKQAVTHVKKAIAAKPRSAAYHFFLGVYLEKSGKYKECIETMYKVVQIDPSYSAAYNYIGYLYAERGEKLLEAKSLVEKALQLQPGNGLYLDSLGWVYFKLKDYAKAKKYLEKALEKSPDEGVIMAHLGEVYLALGNKERAMQYYRESLQRKLDTAEKEKIKSRFISLGGRV